MILTVDCRHEQVNVKSYHIFPGITKLLADASRHLFDPASILSQVYVDYPCVV